MYTNTHMCIFNRRSSSVAAVASSFQPPHAPPTLDTSGSGDHSARSSSSNSANMNIAGLFTSAYSAQPPLPKIARHLIVDDSSWNRLVLRRVLVGIGLEVEEAEDGKSAIAQVMEHGEFAIIWMDIRMGANKMSGIAATQQLRQKHHYGGVIIGLTGYVDEKTYEQCMACGMSHFLSKPWLVDTVKMYSSKYKLLEGTDVKSGEGARLSLSPASRRHSS